MLEGANFMAPVDALYSPNNYSKSLVASTFHLTKLSHIETMSELQWTYQLQLIMVKKWIYWLFMVKERLLLQNMAYWTISMVCLC